MDNLIEKIMESITRAGICHKGSEWHIEIETILEKQLQSLSKNAGKCKNCKRLEDEIEDMRLEALEEYD